MARGLLQVRQFPRPTHHVLHLRERSEDVEDGQVSHRWHSSRVTMTAEVWNIYPLTAVTKPFTEVFCPMPTSKRNHNSHVVQKKLTACSGGSPPPPLHRPWLVTDGVFAGPRRVIMGSVKSQRAAGKTNWLRHGSVLHPSHQTAVGLPTSPGGRVGAIQRTSLGHAGTLIPRSPFSLHPCLGSPRMATQMFTLSLARLSVSTSVTSFPSPDAISFDPTRWCSQMLCNSPSNSELQRVPSLSALVSQGLMASMPRRMALL